MSSETMKKERLAVVFQEHWITYVAPALIFFVLLVMSAVAFYIAARSAYHQSAVSSSSFLIALGFLLCAHHALFHLLLSEELSHIIITNRRIIKLDERLFLRDDMIEVPLGKMRSARATKHGILQILLGYGTLHIDPEKDIELVPHPHRILRDVMKVLEME